MAWKGRDDNVEADFNQLLQILNNSRIQIENNALYQVIRNLILASQKNKNINEEKFGDVTNQINNVINGNTTINNTSLTDPTYITVDNESAQLPNSRQLLAGTNVSFDDTVANKRTINVTAAAGDYVVLSDGATPTPAPIDDGFGNFIYILYTP